MIKQKCSYLNKKWSNVIFTIFFVILQYSICVNIFLMGDDFMYTVFAREGCVKSAWSYYFTGNGRWILNILDSFILKFDRYLYVILCPWILLLLAWLLYKIAIQITHKQSENGMIIALLLVSIIDISISRETIYWITGGLNYLIPGVIFLGAVSAVLYLRENKNCSIWKKIGCGVVCVVSSATMEQFALMTVGWMTLLFGYDLYRKHKVSKAEIIIYIVSVVGLFSIIFAPGNAVRIQNAAEESQTVVTKLIDLFYMNYYSVQAAKYITVISAAETIILAKKKKNIVAVLALANTGILFGVFVLGCLPAKGIFVIISVDIFMVTTVKVLNYLKEKVALSYFVIMMILAVGSQIMLLTGTIWGFRTSFCVIVLYSLFVMIMYATYEEYGVFDIILCCCGFCAHWSIGVIVLVFSFCKAIKKNKQNAIIQIGFVCIVICGCLIPVALGYSSNRSVHEANMEQTKMVREPNVSDIKIQQYTDEIYGWTNPPYGEIHEKFFRKCYGIPKDVKIIYGGENR